MDKQFNHLTDGANDLSEQFLALAEQMAEFMALQNLLATHVPGSRPSVNTQASISSNKGPEAVERSPEVTNRANKLSEAGRPSHTADLQSELAQSIATSSSVVPTQITPEDIGKFNPHHPDLKEIGIVTSSSTIFFSDVNCFVDRINTFLENPTTASANEKQILSMIQTLLNGPASLWWSNELTDRDRRSLRRAGLAAVLSALQERFRLNPATAIAKFNNSTLALPDIAADEEILPQYVRRMLRYARATSILGDGNVNWQGVMTQIWSSFSLEIKQLLLGPSQSSTLEDYLQRIEKTKPYLFALAVEMYPGVKPQHAQTWRSDRSMTSTSARHEDPDGRGSPSHSAGYRGYRNDRDFDGEQLLDSYRPQYDRQDRHHYRQRRRSLTRDSKRGCYDSGRKEGNRNSRHSSPSRGEDQAYAGNRSERSSTTDFFDSIDSRCSPTTYLS